MVKYFVQVLEIEDILRLWGLMPSGQIDKRATQKHTFERAWRMTEGPDGINDSIGCRQTKMWVDSSCFKNIVNFNLSSMRACSDLCLGHENHADTSELQFKYS
jgi:hypothetical protein